MGDDHDIRASDRDRDAVVTTLRDAYAAGRLTLEEFDERTTAAYAGRTWGELRELTKDLPEKAVLGADLPVKPEMPDPALADPDQPQQPLPKAPPLTDRSMPPGLDRQRRRPLMPVIPFILVWILIARATDGRAGLALVAVIVLLVLVSAVNRHWRGK